MFVPMLFLAPLPLVPLLVAAGFTLGRIRQRIGAHERGHALVGPRRHVVHARLRSGSSRRFAPSGPPTLDSVEIYAARARRAWSSRAPRSPSSHELARRMTAQPVWPVLWACRVDAVARPARSPGRDPGARAARSAPRRRPAPLAAPRLLPGAQGALHRLARAAQRLPRHRDAAVRRGRGRGRLHGRSTAARSSSWSPRSPRS